ncbi:hypothetical protein SAMN05421630_10598 [Prauserella marina]|uniref:Uncharacterized protein n=1 Tax=Prauserella marina TaxID=530584 RepID=A0A1G6R4L2_9PSEU|nr:hypothetical protein DES30_10597 [Prauserella marina]SDC99599.1 hypothetical protein SAMN05421630_10598 [Prauserella marina]
MYSPDSPLIRTKVRNMCQGACRGGHRAPASPPPGHRDPHSGRRHPRPGRRVRRPGPRVAHSARSDRCEWTRTSGGSPRSTNTGIYQAPHGTAAFGKKPWCGWKADSPDEAARDPFHPASGFLPPSEASATSPEPPRHRGEPSRHRSGTVPTARVARHQAATGGNHLGHRNRSPRGRHRGGCPREGAGGVASLASPHRCAFFLEGQGTFPCVG